MDHLQIGLSSIADRVIPIIDENDSSIFDQSCRIFMESIGSHLQDEEKEDDHILKILNDVVEAKNTDSLLNNPKQPLLKRIHSMVQIYESQNEKDDHGSDNNNNNNNSESDDNDSNNSEVENSLSTKNLNDERKFKFNPFIAKVVYGIPVGAYYLNRKVMSTVR